MSQSDYHTPIENIPLKGKMITVTFDNPISKTLINIIEKALTDLASDRNKLNDTINAILNSLEYIDKATSIISFYSQIASDIIDLIKKK